MLPPTPVRLVPGLLQARGLAIGMKRLREALNSGVIPGTILISELLRRLSRRAGGS